MPLRLSGIRLSLRLCALLVSAALAASGCQSGDSGDAASASEGRAPDRLTEMQGALVYRPGRIAGFDKASGKILWEREIKERLFPYRVAEIESKTGKRRYLLTWIDGNASPSVAILDASLRPKYTRRRASLSARLGDAFAVEILEHTGPEGLHTFRTEIFDAERLLVASEFPRQSRLDALATGGNAAPWRIVMAGPEISGDEFESETEIVSVYDLRSGKTVFSTKVKKRSPERLELLASTGAKFVFYYQLDYYELEILCLDDSGEVLWTEEYDGQVLSTVEYPYSGWANSSPCATDPKGKRVAYFIAVLNSPPHLYIRDLESGRILASQVTSGAPGLPSHVEWSENGLLISFGRGKSAWLLNPDDGSIKDAEPQSLPAPVERRMAGLSHEADGDGIAPFNGIILPDGAAIPLSNFTGRRIKTYGSANGNDSGKTYEYGEPALGQDIAPVEKYAVVDGAIVIGDELSPSGWRFYGDYRILLTADELVFLDEKGAESGKYKLIEK
jgi:hypothetical protein